DQFEWTDRYISDFFERSVKALDVNNAIRDGIEQIRQWQKHLEIVVCAFANRNKIINEGQFRRAKKANRSFGRHTAQTEHKSFGHLRSLSWSVSRSWSAARQLLAIGNNLVAPRANEITSTNGLNLAVFTMNYMLFFVMWALVAAIPCQYRGLQTHFNESKKRDRRKTCGLLKDIRDIEICARHMNELTDSDGLDPLERQVREVFHRIVISRNEGLASK
ncbi:hypothetical protein MIMGU_mgv1a024476mg, partial [Erythranthe guttata]